MPVSVLSVASEAVPLAKTGGLADVTSLGNSQVPSTFSASTARFLVSVTLGLGAGLALAAVFRLRPPPTPAPAPTRTQPVTS